MTPITKQNRIASVHFVLFTKHFNLYIIEPFKSGLPSFVVMQNNFSDPSHLVKYTDTFKLFTHEFVGFFEGVYKL